LKKAEIVFNVDNSPLKFVKLTSMLETSLETYVAANKPCIV